MAVCYLQSQAVKAHLVGLFLDEFIYRSYNVMEVIKSGDNYERVMAELDQEDRFLYAGFPLSLLKNLFV